MKYRLYILRYTKSIVEDLKMYRFTRITPDYALCYTEGKQPLKSAEITEEDLPNLSSDDRKWLKETNFSILREFVEKHHAEIEKAEKAFVEEFKKQLDIVRGERIGEELSRNVPKAGSGL